MSARGARGRVSSRFLALAASALLLVGVVPGVTLGSAAIGSGPASADASPLRPSATSGAVSAAALPTIAGAVRDVGPAPSRALNAHPTRHSISPAGSGPKLVVQAPARVAVGQPIELSLSVVGARDLAGYELVLSYDRSAAEFSGLSQRRIALAGSGRSVQSLGPVEVAQGVAFGLWSCPWADCLRPAGTRRTRGASGSVRLADVSVTPSSAGELELRLGSVRFVDSYGREVRVAAPDAVTVAVGGYGPSHPALSVSVPVHGAGTTVATRDLTGDGAVDFADAMEAAARWESGRQAGSVCGVVSHADVNADRCVDVGDVQAIAAGVVARKSLRAPTTRTLGGAPVATSAASTTQAAASTTQLSSTPTYTVDTTGDGVDTNPGDGICAAGTSGCTLRAALREAQVHPGPDTIAFALPGTGVRTITVGSELPALNDSSGGVTIDGYTQTGATPNTDGLVSNARILVELKGTGTGTGATVDPLRITSANNIVRGLALYNFHKSIYITGIGATNNRVVGVFIGTNAAGTWTAPAWISGGNAVVMNQGAAHNVIGSPAVEDRNVVTGNEANGITFYDERTDWNVVQNNLVGLAPTGLPLKAVNGYGQVAHGIDINTGASYNLIGGTGTREHNVVSNNRGEGIEISHSTMTVNNSVVGNYVGTDVAGTGGSAGQYGNGLRGIHIEDGPTNNRITSNIVASSAQRSGLDSEADPARVGGIGIEGFYTTGNMVRDNLVGIGRTGATLPNRNYGVQVSFHAAWQTIGPGNTIANSPVGVRISDADDLYNTITANSIQSSSYLGIDLATGTGVNANDPGDADSGANTQLNFPVLTAASPQAVTGTACANCRVEIFRAAAVSTDAGSGMYGQGATLVGFGTAGGNGAFTINLSGVVAGDLLTSTATDGLGNTSEFSLNLTVTASPTPGPVTDPPPPAPSNVIASDSFSRTYSAGGWGRAPIGGGYAALYCTSLDLNVDGSAGTMLAPDGRLTQTCAKDQPAVVNVTNTRAAYLTDAIARDVGISFRFKTAALASGDFQNVGFSARRSSGRQEYRGQLRLNTLGQVYVQAATVIGSSITFLGTNTRVVGLSYAPGTYLSVRGEVTGASPTTIRLKVWQSDLAEPSTWQYTVTDSTPALQGPGSPGLFSFLSPANTNGPTLFTFDDLLVTDLAAPPVASFTAVQTANSLDVAFTDTSGNGPTSWSWDFGDGSPRSTTQNPTHSYVAAGSYTVQLTATNAAGSDTATRSVTVVAPVTYAADAYTRTLASSWGAADTGGSYTYSVGNGSLSDFAVSGGVGTVRVATAGTTSSTRAAFLPVSVRDVDVSVKVRLDRLLAGGSGTYVYLGARRDSSTNAQYRLKLHFLSDGRVYMTASTLTGSPSVETAIGTEVALPGGTSAYTANTDLLVRLRVTGAGPTLIQGRAWRAGTTEPTTWLLDRTDSTAALASAGGIGLWTYLSSNLAAGTVQFSFDDYRAINPN